MLISQNLAIVHHNASYGDCSHSLFVYEFDSSAVRAVHSLSGPGAPLCILGLPEYSSSALLYGTQNSEFIVGVHLPPTYPPSSDNPTPSSPLFAQDPKCAMIVLKMNIGVSGTREGDGATRDQYFFFIPLSTLYNTISRQPRSPGTPLVVFWNEWGPMGTRIVRVKIQLSLISVEGSRCAVAPRVFRGTRGTSPFEVITFDVHPWARLNQETLPPDLQKVFDAGDTLEHTPAFAEPIISRYPFHVTTTSTDTFSDPFFDKWVVLLVVDGLVLVRSKWE